MKRCLTILIGLLLPLFILFSGIGYASVTDNLVLLGNGRAMPINDVYIVDVNYSSGDGSIEVIHYSETVLRSKVTLNNRSNSTLEIAIKVKNNTIESYTYNGIKYESSLDVYDNENIQTSTNIKRGQTINSQEELTFYATFKYVSSPISNNILNSLVNFSFVPSSRFIPDTTADNVVEKFDEIINNNYDYQKLTQAMENTTSGERPNTPDGRSYIGNVIGSSGKDSEVIEELFGKENLKMDIGSEKIDVTLIIKKEDVDSSVEGEELTLYITPNTPTGTYGRIIFGIPVTTNQVRPWLDDIYAVTYTVDPITNKWTQLGDCYKGRAKCTVYSSIPEPVYSDLNDSFNTNTWESTESYYNLKIGSSLKDILANRPKN